ncbi:hypothetical protein PtA15_15A267 [Puccinia triticina]|uniref:Uncharacterized protein n=1 Tax=Puccinia triticina TaxID=208348 RepID=A0ABY7D4Q5_9BASI|nr:uncharacterized protein PtA15_15A267 [Puccinia triticina]WAQ91875.1 hypothetical protein PtA15_15A267 [Puccinia triticina]
MSNLNILAAGDQAENWNHWHLEEEFRFNHVPFQTSQSGQTRQRSGAVGSLRELHFVSSFKLLVNLLLSTNQITRSGTVVCSAAPEQVLPIHIETTQAPPNLSQQKKMELRHPLSGKSPVQLDENHDPTASTQFPHESNSEDAGPFGNHIFSDRFSSPSILPTYSSIPSTLAPGDPDALVKPAFQTETPSPTFNEHPTIAPSAPTPHTPKKATMEKTLKPTGRNFKRPAMKLKAAKISEASEELKATNKSEENLEKILGLEGIQENA